MMFLLCKIDIILNQNIQVDRKSLFNGSWRLELNQNIQFTSNFTNFTVKFIVKFNTKDIFLIEFLVCGCSIVRRFPGLCSGPRLGALKRATPDPPSSIRVSDASRPRMIRVPSTIEHLGKIRIPPPCQKILDVILYRNIYYM